MCRHYNKQDGYLRRGGRIIYMIKMTTDENDLIRIEILSAFNSEEMSLN